MTESLEDQTTATAEHPPAGPSRWATVTVLGVADTPPVDPPAAVAAVDGALALQGPLTRAATPGPPRTPELRLVPAAGGRDELQVWAARFAQAVVEVLGGDRPLTQLVRWTSHRVYLDLERRLALLARTSDAGRRMRTIRPQVRSVHVFRPTGHSAEVSVHVRHGQRSRAIAARLELSRGRWQCTALQLG